MTEPAFTDLAQKLMDDTEANMRLDQLERELKDAQAAVAAIEKRMAEGVTDGN